MENLEVRFYPSGRVAVINTTAKLVEYNDRGIGNAIRNFTDSRNNARKQIIGSAALLSSCGVAGAVIALKSILSGSLDFLPAIGLMTTFGRIPWDISNLYGAKQNKNYYSKILKAFPAVVLSLEEMSSKRSPFRLPI